MIDRTSHDWARHEEGAEPLAALLEDLLQSWDLSAPGERGAGAGKPEPAAPTEESPGVEQLFAALSQRLSTPSAGPAANEATEPAQQQDNRAGETTEPERPIGDSLVSSEPGAPSGLLWLSELPNAGEAQPLARSAPRTISAGPVASPEPEQAMFEDEDTELAGETAALFPAEATLWAEPAVSQTPEASPVTAIAPALEEGPEPEAAAPSEPEEPAAAETQPEIPAAKRANLASDGGEIKVPISEYAPNDRYLLFRMSGDLFALSLPGVSEAERLPSLTPVPGMPAFLRGIFSHRGEIVPLLNLPELLGLEQEDQHLSTGKIMIVRSPHGPLALAAESLEGLSGIFPHEIDHLAELGGTLRPAVKGTAQLGNRTVCVLDLEKVFALEKLKDLVGADSAIPETV